MNKARWPMKCALVITIFSLMPTGCSPGDAKIQQQLTGTWVVDVGSDARSTNIIHQDGRYEAEVIGLTNGHIASMEGTLSVRNGVLTMTTTKHSNTNAPNPFVQRGRVIRVNAHELVVRWDDMPNETVLRKVDR